MNKIAGALLIIIALLLFYMTPDNNMFAGGVAGIIFGIGLMNIVI